MFNMKKLFITGLVTAILITAGVFFIAGVMHVIVTGDGRAHAELACGAEYFVDRENRLSYEDVINDSIPFAARGQPFSQPCSFSVWINAASRRYQLLSIQ
jgi:hypothetical protein